MRCLHSNQIPFFRLIGDLYFQEVHIGVHDRAFKNGVRKLQKNPFAFFFHERHVCNCCKAICQLEVKQGLPKCFILTPGTSTHKHIERKNIEICL